MSKVIWKYPLEVRDSNVIKMPEGAKILCVQTQNNIPCIWAIVDAEESLENRFFRIVGTGQFLQKEYLDYKEYIGTFQLDNGLLVFHLFEDM
jgi:hypothetical protein